MRSFQKLTIFIVFVWIIVGCQANPEDATTGRLTEDRLVGTTWTLTKIVTYELPEDANSVKEVIVDGDKLNDAFTLKFNTEFLGGEAGCKSYRGNWFLDEFGRLSLSGQLSVTENCEQADPEIESDYIEALQNVAFAELNAGFLEIKSPQNGTLFFTEQ